MDCQEIKENASSFYHQEIEENMRAVIYEHLQFCSSCHQEYQDFRKLLKHFSNFSTEKIFVEADYFDRLLFKASRDFGLPLSFRKKCTKTILQGKNKKKRKSWMVVVASFLILGIVFFVAPKKQPLSFPKNSSKKIKISPTRPSTIPLQKEYIRYLAMMDPEDVQANYRLSLWCKQKKLLFKAERHLQKVISLREKHPKNQELMGDLKF